MRGGRRFAFVLASGAMTLDTGAPPGRGANGGHGQRCRPYAPPLLFRNAGDMPDDLGHRTDVSLAAVLTLW